MQNAASRRQLEACDAKAVSRRYQLDTRSFPGELVELASELESELGYNLFQYSRGQLLFACDVERIEFESAQKVMQVADELSAAGEDMGLDVYYPDSYKEYLATQIRSGHFHYNCDQHNVLARVG